MNKISLIPVEGFRPFQRGICENPKPRDATLKGFPSPIHAAFTQSGEDPTRNLM